MGIWEAGESQKSWNEEFLGLSREGWSRWELGPGLAQGFPEMKALNAVFGCPEKGKFHSFHNCLLSEHDEYTGGENYGLMVFFAE